MRTKKLSRRVLSTLSESPTLPFVVASFLMLVMFVDQSGLAWESAANRLQAHLRRSWRKAHPKLSLPLRHRASRAAPVITPVVMGPPLETNPRLSI